MRKRHNNDKFKFYRGGVRDKNSIDYSKRWVDFVFHEAALKFVLSCKFYPMQAVELELLA